jgi:hypothetical protein
MSREGFINFLTVLILLTAIILAIYMVVLFVNPATFLNPLSPQDLPELVVIPSATWSQPQIPDIVTESVPEVTVVTATPRNIEPTWTPLPTFTSFVLPTATNTLTPTATFTETATLTPTSAAYQCIVVSSYPESGRTFPPGGDFDGRWTIENTGLETWEASVDLVYISGTKFQAYADAVDLPKIVEPGKSVDVIVDMLAPREAGTYDTRWALRKNDRYFCEVSLRITVK